MNQCDGCRQGLKLHDGFHVDDDGYAKMVCQKEKYTPMHESNEGIASDIIRPLFRWAEASIIEKAGDEILEALDQKDLAHKEEMRLLTQERDVEIKRARQAEARANLLSVEANTIRDAYDNGLNATLQSRIKVLEEALRPFAFQAEFHTEVDDAPYLPHCSHCDDSEYPCDYVKANQALQSGGKGES